jgi:hypothetical protein
VCRTKKAASPNADTKGEGKTVAAEDFKKLEEKATKSKYRALA